MRKQRTFWFTLVLSMMLGLMTACGSGPNPASSTKSVAGENLYVLDSYTSSADAHIIAFRPGQSNATMTLPDGLTTRDHKLLYTAAAQNSQTLITVTDTHTGKAVRSLTIPGTYSTAGALYTNADLSYDGHWLALRQLNTGIDQTSIALVDAQTAKLSQTVQLQGDFDLDVVSPDGNRLYLLQRLHDQAGHYLVRRYDIDEAKLYPDPIVEKGETDPNMVGSALTRQLALDGQGAYTLYTEPKLNKAFIHMLPLSDFWPSFALCLDLPVGKSPDLLRYYTLTLSADGTTLYAVNAALGIVQSFSVSDPPNNPFVNATLDQNISFHTENSSLASQSRALYNGAVLSPDQKTLYTVGAHGILALSTSDVSVEHNYLMQQTFTGIAVSANGKALYAVDPSSGLLLIDLSTGQASKIANSPAQNPLGIAWVAN